MNFQEALFNEIQLLLLPIAAAGEGGSSGQLLSEVTGWQLGPDSAPSLGTFIDAYNNLNNLIADQPASLADILKALESANQLFTVARQLPVQPGVEAQALGNLAQSFIESLVIDYLKSWHTEIFDILLLLAVIEPPNISLSRIADLISDPLKVLRTEYLQPQGLATTADAKALADKLFPRLAALLGDLGFHAVYADKPENGMDLGEIGNHVAPAMLSVYLQPDFQTENRYGVLLALSSKDLGNYGLVVIPFGKLLPYWDVDIDLSAAAAGFAVGSQGFTLFGTSSATGVSGTPVILKLPGLLIGGVTGTRLEIEQFQIAGDVSLNTSNPEYGMLLDLGSSALVITSSDGDGFLQSVLPSGGTQANFDFAIGWSNRRGLYFRGSIGLDATLPVGISIGGAITIPSIHLALQANNAAVTTEMSISVGLSIGPVQALVDRVGIMSSITFPSNDDGNLGVADLAFGFKPPSGVGLSIDSAGVSGGGFLAHYDAKREYSGVLQLTSNDLTLQAFGLITTQVAGGNGYSLLALIDANFPPVQLGWGFTLNGVGGLLAVHRTASVDALRAAVKSGKIASILFPTSPITNASQILGTLDTLFPTAPGRFLFGPMALIGWGANILTASVAVIIELPEPIEIVLLAKLTAQLPNPSAPLVKLNMDALGVLDLTQDDLSLDASLFDSKLINFPITGDMALRANWSSQREFLLAIGGFHPQFTPPADFPSLNRVTINMPSGIVSKLRLAAYLALTSNSVQFGATLDVFIGVSGCGISGHLGFDALLQLDPFHFTADISGSVAITFSGDDLASVSLDASLSGPAPWNIAGSFKIHIIFFDVHKSFSKSWGLSAPSQQTSTVDVGALLNTALADPRNWSSQLPAGVSSLVATRKVDDASSIFAHPLAMLEVHEQIVPLGLTITHFGEAVPSGATEFSITDFRIGSQSTTPKAVQDDFAPAQFFDLSDNDKLSRPSFERHDAGAIMSGNLVTNGKSFAKTIDYESFFINTPGVVTVDEGVPQPFPWTALPIVMRTGSAALKTISQAGKLRYAAPGNPITVGEPVFTVASTSTLAAVTTPAAAGTTYSDAAAALKSAIATSSNLRETLQIVASHELIKVGA
jgi:hypothetical protein